MQLKIALIILTRECTMKWGLVRVGVAVLSVVTLSPCFANSVKHVYGLEYAKNYNIQTKGNFYIQAAAFSHRSNAENYQKLLQSRTSHPVKISHENKLYTVSIGPINSTPELRKTAASLLNSSKQNIAIRKNRTQVHSSKVIQRHSAPKQRNSVLISKEKESSFSPASHTSANWFVTVGAGAEFPTPKGNISINNGSLFPVPYDKDIYTIHQSASALINVTAGRRWERENNWFPAFSLGVLYQHSFLEPVKGIITQYSLPEYTNYNYRWHLSSDIVLAAAKMNIYAKNRLSPYVTGGLGEAFNHSSYREKALPDVTPRTSPDFSGSDSQFAYNVGAGIDFRVSNNCIINVGYLYQNLGNLSAQGSESWSDTSLSLETYGLNEVLAGATYLFDK